MAESQFGILLILAAIVVVLLLWLSSRGARVYTIDAVELMRLQDARRNRPGSRPRWARRVLTAIIAIVVASLLWGLSV